jgi:membrane protein implicated in regulation of membrane protease activity
MDDVPSPPPLWAVLAVAAALVAAAAYVLYFQLGTVGLHALAIIVGALALTALVALHYRQTALLARQAELQRRQLRLREERGAPSRPAVELGPVEVDGDEIAVSLSNGGSVAVRELSLVVDSAFPDDGGFGGATAVAPLRRAATDGGTFAPRRDAGREPEPDADAPPSRPHGGADALGPGETDQRFAAGPELAFVAPDGTEHVAPVDEALVRLGEANAGRVAVRVALEHADADGGRTRQYVTGGVASPDADDRRLADVVHGW